MYLTLWVRFSKEASDDSNRTQQKAKEVIQVRADGQTL